MTKQKRKNPFSFFLKKISSSSCDKRRFKRVRAPFLLKYQVKESGFGNITNIRDISVSGARFAADHPLLKGSQVALEINLPTSEKPISVDGKVVRVSRLKSLSAYRIAIRFTRIEPKDRTAIRLLVERMWRDKRVKGLVDRKFFFW